ncbi:MAG: hypothetical protein HUN04_22515 [Desulfobacter sp.]|nr:MAG: hypothetical protein HUN04_22515 [Desulfobacter sp.]
MKKQIHFYLFIFACFAFYGCLTHEEMIDKFLPKHVDTFAKQSIQMVKGKKLDSILARFDESIKGGQINNTLYSIFDYMDKGDISETITTGVHVKKLNKNITYNISYQLKYQDNYQLVNIVLFDDGGGLKIKGFHVNALPDSLDKLHRFTFKGKSFKHYVFFLLNISYILFITVAFIVCLRTKNLKRKWLWAIVTILGVGELLFNWTSGAWSIKPLNIGFNISSFIQPTPYMASILKFYIPVGAIAFFIKKATIKRKKAVEG